jgi:hypothetical protein
MMRGLRVFSTSRTTPAYSLLLFPQAVLSVNGREREGPFELADHFTAYAASCPAFYRTDLR